MPLLAGNRWKGECTGQLACHVHLPPSTASEQGQLVRLFFLYGLARVGCELRADVGEGSIDSSGKSAHAGRSCKGYERDNKCVLDKILALFAVQNALDFHRQFPQLIFHLNPPCVLFSSR